MRFGIIYSMFIMGFAESYYIIFQSYEDPEENPMPNPVESFIQVSSCYHVSWLQNRIVKQDLSGIVSK